MSDAAERAAAPADATAAPAVALPWRELRGAGVLAVLWAFLPAVLGGVLLWRLGLVAAWLGEDRAVGLALYVALFALTAGLGLLPTYAQAVLGGWVFGFRDGLLAALAGFTLAALLGYAIARAISGDRVRALVERHPRAAAVHAALVCAGPRRSTGVVALLRLPPNSPFALSNLAFAAAGVGVLPFVVGTVLGMAPRTAIAAALAHAGAASGARDLAEFVERGPGWGVLIGGIAVALGVFALLSRMARAALARAGLAPCDPPATAC